MQKKLTRGAIVAAACALPGIALAESAPSEGLVGFKYLYYRDWQPGLDRIKVSSPALFVLVPIGPHWSMEGALVSDTISGATPQWHTSISSASKMSDKRTAGDVKLTRYFRRAAIGLGAAYSTENDYKSKAVNADLRMSTDDNNTTFTFGGAFVDDRIDPVNGKVVDEKKRTKEVLVGITRVLSQNDIARFNFTHAWGRGYFTDPYKFDNRPRARNQLAALGQWNHHFGGIDGTLRTTYRYYQDTFEVKAHTATFEYAQALGGSVVITPALRYHTQSAAYFYYDPVYEPGNEPRPPGFDPSKRYSADHRLSAFGALTVGLKGAVTFARLWTVDLRYDRYEQRSDWYLGGKGSPGLAPFSADYIQLGISRRF
jgi:hypothetical protein